MSIVAEVKNAMHVTGQFSDEILNALTQHDIDNTIYSGRPTKSERAKKLKLVFSLFAVFMLFTPISVKNAYSWSPFSSELTGEWVEDGGLIPLHLTFYSDGKLKILGVERYSYKTSFSEVEITFNPIFGSSYKSTHKFSIDNGILSFNPPLFEVVHFKRIQ